MSTNIKKIAILRANALGDFIFSLPAITALRKTNPLAEIVLLGKQWHKDFLQNRPSPIDKVIVIPPTPGVGEAEDFKPDTAQQNSFFQKMKKEKFDIAIQLHGGGKYSNTFIKKLNYKLSVGLKTPNAASLDINIPYIYYQNEYLRYLEVVSHIGVIPQSIVPSITATHIDFNQAKRAYSDLDYPFVVLHPGANDVRRRWNTKYFSQVGNYLVKTGFQVVVTGTEGEQFLADDIEQHMSFPIINLCNKLSLSGLTGLFSFASLIISNDTGPLHLAYALNIPSIGLFWCGNMINGAPPTREHIRPLISWMIHCPLCGADCSSFFPFQPIKSCAHNASFIDNIEVGEVINTIDEILNNA